MKIDGMEKFTTDFDSEAVKGISLTYGTMTFVCRRAGGRNEAFHKAMRERSDKLGKTVKLMSVRQNISEMAAVYADTVIIDWDLKSEGKPLELTRENIIKVLTEYPDLFAVLAEDAGNPDLFLADSDGKK